MRTVARLREARNLFRQWEDDVSFTGYWDADLPVRVANKDFRASLYRRPGSALLVIGNTGEAGRSKIAPNWKALGIDPKTARLADPETGRGIPLEGDGFAVDVRRHDVRLVLVGDLQHYPYQYASPGSDLPKPKTVLKELCDPLRGPKLDAAWTADLHEGNASTGFVDGRLFIQYSHYGYSHIRRKLGKNNISVQCMVMGRPTGCSDTHCAGLGLWWANGAFVRVIPGYRKHKFYYEIKGQRPRFGKKIHLDAAPRWHPYSPNGVKIQLTPEAIRFFVSTDGKTWRQDHQVKRGKALAGAPEWVVLGNGGSHGKQPLFRNVISQHFVPERANRVALFTDFVVGKE
jgi:glycosyl hydrolase family 123